MPRREIAGRRALLVVNRHSGGRAAELARAIATLEGEGLAILRYDTSSPGEMAQALRDGRERMDLVVIAGGDGTMNAAAEALVETGLPLGILPLGTGNDLARTLSLPRSLPEVARVIAAGRTRPIDLGTAGERPFFTAACVGLGSDVLRYQTTGRKRLWRGLSYLISAVQAYVRARPFRAKITCDGKAFEAQALHIAIGNSRYYGGGLIVAAGAAIDDGRLDLACFEAASFWRMLAVVPGLLTGRLESRGPVLVVRGRELEVWTERPMPINADGEIVGETPARFTVLPHALRVFAPEGT